MHRKRGIFLGKNDIFYFIILFLLPELKPIPYYDPAGKKPSPFEDYVKSFSEKPYQEVVAYREAVLPTPDRLVLIFVNSALSPEIQTYRQDLENEGYEPKV